MTRTTDQPDKKAGKMTNEGEELFKTVFGRLQMGILIIEPHTHTIIDANPIAEEILGVSKAGLVHRKCHAFICPAKDGECPVTDMNTAIENEERVFINTKGEEVTVLLTVAQAKINDKNYLVESFIDISDRKKADDRKAALIGFMNESVLRIRRPLELTKMNMQLIADQVKSGEFEPEEIRMELQIQANNITQMLKNLDDLVRMVAEERRQDIPQEFRDFLLGK